MNKKLRILLKKVGEKPIDTFVEDTLEAKQKLVGGLIEVVPLADVLLVCNEEGKILNMQPNLIFDYDYFAGDCFVIGDDYENGDFKSLTDEQVEEYTKLLEERSFICRDDHFLKEGRDRDDD